MAKSLFGNRVLTSICQHEFFLPSACRLSLNILYPNPIIQTLSGPILYIINDVDRVNLVSDWLRVIDNLASDWLRE
jgi:hypothetical protein